MDLRDLGALQSLLQSAGFQPNVPTFVLAECVLVYMEPHESAALVKHLGQQLPSAVCVVYEQVAHLHFNDLLPADLCRAWQGPVHRCTLHFVLAAMSCRDIHVYSIRGGPGTHSSICTSCLWHLSTDIGTEC